MKRVYGWRPDVPDFRDKKVSKDAKHMLFAYENLPTKIDWRNFCSTVEDQGKLGSCTGNAIVGGMEMMARRDGRDQSDLSRLFLYYNERADEGTIWQDSGAYIRDGIKSAASIGVCKESLWPYDISRFTNAPPSSAYEEAFNHRITIYARVSNDSQEFKSLLASGHPIVFGMSVYDSFESDAVARSGVVPMPGPTEVCLGGHAALAVGYDDDSETVLVRNSWGEGWGQKGYFTLPYSYFLNEGLVDDKWVMESL